MNLQAAWRRKFRIQIESERCLLRPLVAEDLDWLTELIADREVSRFLAEHVESRDMARKFAEAIVFLDLRRSMFGHWAIQDKATGDIHGWAELSKLRPWSGPDDEIAVSYVLRRASWGQGLATEAAGALVTCALEAGWLERILAVIDAENAASRRVLQKIGMRSIQISDSRDGKRLEYFQIDVLRAL